MRPQIYSSLLLSHTTNIFIIDSLIHSYLYASILTPIHMYMYSTDYILHWLYIPLIIYSTDYIFHWYQVRSQGRDFSSLYWKDLSSSIFPLHTAVSNLCHCNPTSENGECVVLQNVIQWVSELGCNFNATDSIGNTALHIALSVCPERYFRSRLFISHSLFIVISSWYHKYFSPTKNLCVAR